MLFTGIASCSKSGGLIVDNVSTHPKAEGYVIGSSIKHIPIAGRDISAFVQQLLRERGETIPPEDSLYVSQRIKEMYSYVCPDIVKEFKKYEQDPSYFKKFEGNHSVTGKVRTFPIIFQPSNAQCV
jgi:actin-related protein 3